MTFPPNPFAYEEWSKAGHDKISTWKVMLECNYASPFSEADSSIPEGGRTNNETALMLKCMEGQGFNQYPENPSTSFCRTFNEVPACRPGAVIPGPDVGVRLNSGYCKKYPRSEACVP